MENLGRKTCGPQALARLRAERLTSPHVLRSAARSGQPESAACRGTDRLEFGSPAPARQLNGLCTTVQRVRTRRLGVASAARPGNWKTRPDARRSGNATSGNWWSEAIWAGPSDSYSEGPFHCPAVAALRLARRVDSLSVPSIATEPESSFRLMPVAQLQAPPAAQLSAARARGRVGVGVADDYDAAHQTGTHWAWV